MADPDAGTTNRTGKSSLDLVSDDEPNNSPLPQPPGQEDSASVTESCGSASSSSTSSDDSILAECVLPPNHHRRLSKMISVPVKMPTNTGTSGGQTYIFPGVSTSVPAHGGHGVRGHARSISHGGGSLMSHHHHPPPPQHNMLTATGARPVPLKSAMRGHQRAFSQGQIIDNGSGGIGGLAPGTGGAVAGTSNPPRSGHNRVGSKTDFILPPGHKDSPQSRDTGTLSSGSLSGSGAGGAGTGGRGHSRQASRSESIYTLRRAEVPPWWKRFPFCSPPKPSEEYSRYRTVVPNHTVPGKTPKRDHPNGRWSGNKIRTTKYTLLSFIPKNLLEQFHRVANLYFLFIVVLNWFPAINAFGKEVAMIPVLFVLGVTAIKDLFEDRRRRASDQRINNTTCRVYCGESERYKRVIWQEVRVGDIVHLSNHETVPADILLLRTSDPHSVCYIDTCDLDGETNLKRREVVRGFVDKQTEFQANKFTSRVEVDPPSTKIYRFHGALVHATGERIPVSTDNLLLRESRLKNTDFIEGLVVYAGHETKAMLNNSGPRYKRSQLEQMMNIDVIWCVLILIVMCLLGAFACKLWLDPFEGKDIPFLPFDVYPGYEALMTFWTFVIILQIMIPLSLYVTIELCKLMQVHYIHNNQNLYCPATNKRSECRAMNITEELGQIQYIFSDKTGTLTENKMIFRRCVINGDDYNHPETEAEKAFLKPGAPMPPVVANQCLMRDMGVLAKSPSAPGEEVDYSQNAQRIHEFLLVMAICNTVVVSATPHRDSMNASGMIEEDSLLRSSTMATGDMRGGGTGDGPGSGVQSISDRYTRLAESRSITPSPPPMGLGHSSNPPPTTLNLKPSMPPSLSPISSSAESSPLSESPRMVPDAEARRRPNSSVISPTAKAKSIIVSKFAMLSSVLQNKNKKSLLTKKGSQSLLGRPIYEAESPDELALVNAAYAYGCCLINRSPHHTLVNVPGEGIAEFEVLKVLPFDSNRKCMSIIVRRLGASELTLYTKGADTSIMQVLTANPADSHEGVLREQTQLQLDNYAKDGLRVLVMAKKTMTMAEYSEWYNKHKQLEMSHEHRDKRIRESFSSLEKNLRLLGATGIEDRLQEGVPETIAALISAGIIVWVLTGDKPETAINIAYAAKLFQPQWELLKLTARSRDAAESSIMFYLSEIEKQIAEFGEVRQQKALVVDGKTLTYMLDMRSNLVKPFLKLTKYCASVLCCRSTPLQKAYLVKVVKEEYQLRTLAIGDGANDVSMIQMADVGVGISGQEGMQAVMAADFTLPRFKYLENLLLIHGFWSYDRLARMILYFFYKNATCVYLIFWFQLYCGFSGAVMIDQMYLMLYNLLFTSLPPMAIAVYDKCVAEDLLYTKPGLYRHGREGRSYRPHDFWLVMLESVYQSLVIFFVAVMAYWGTDVSIFEFGTTIASASLVAMLLHCAIQIKSWSILHVLSLAISLGAYYAYSFLYGMTCVNCFGLPSTYWVINMCAKSHVYWLVILLTAVVAVLPSFTMKIFKETLWPGEITRTVLADRRNQSRGEDPMVVAWSRTTSASSIHRASNLGNQHSSVKGKS